MLIMVNNFGGYSGTCLDRGILRKEFSPLHSKVILEVLGLGRGMHSLSAVVFGLRWF